MKKLLVAMMVVLVSSTALAYNPTHTLHGSRASFLMVDDGWMTLNYLHPQADKLRMRAAALANGDTHIYIYTRNSGDNCGAGAA